MTATLTDLKIANLKPRTKQYEVNDQKVPGLRVRVSPGGTKSFTLWYRLSISPGTPARRMTLGRVGLIKLAEARKTAKAQLVAVAQGKDPAKEKQAARKPHKSEHGFDHLVTSFIVRYAKENTKSWSETERLLKREFVSNWKNRDYRTIRKSDVVVITDAIVDRGSAIAANSAFAAVRKLFNWAVARDMLSSSPCAGLSTPSKTRIRDRILSHAELSAIWHSANAMDYPYGHVINLLMATGQRRNEISDLKWSEINLQQQTLSLAPERNKSGRPHEVHLNDTAVTIISNIPKLSETLVFPARGRQRPISGFLEMEKKVR